MSKINTIIVGAGQAGLAASYELTQHGVSHIVWNADKSAKRGGAGGTIFAL